jgi:hypothetical protein
MGVPETFIVGREGKIVYALVGPVTAENIDTVLMAEIDRRWYGPTRPSAFIRRPDSGLAARASACPKRQQELLPSDRSGRHHDTAMV